MKLTSLILLAALLPLTACGFQPRYGDHSAAMENHQHGKSLTDIDIDMIPDRDGQVMRNELIDMIQPRGPSATPRYKLTFSKLNVAIRELDLTKSSEATRSQVSTTITIYLTDTQTGKIVLSRVLKSISSYNILQSEFATNVTEDNARNNALKDLARQTQLQLSLYMNR